MGECANLPGSLNHILSSVLWYSLLSSCMGAPSENRYLLFLTENYAALEILRHYLNDVMGPTSPTDPLKDRLENMEPFILFGSSFPKDKEYTQVMLQYITQDRIIMWILAEHGRSKRSGRTSFRQIIFGIAHAQKYNVTLLCHKE